MAAAEPFFHMMGKRIHFCGGPGNGQAAKVGCGAPGNPADMLRPQTASTGPPRAQHCKAKCRRELAASMIGT